MPTEPARYRLPWPPSVNNYWKRSKHGIYVTPAAKVFRQEVAIAAYAMNRPTLSGRLEVRITAHPPNARKFDLDNLLKSTLDALEGARVFHNDNQIDHLTIARADREPPGFLMVEIRERKPTPCEPTIGTPKNRPQP